MTLFPHRSLSLPSLPAADAVLVTAPRPPVQTASRIKPFPSTPRMLSYVLAGLILSGQAYSVRAHEQGQTHMPAADETGEIELPSVSVNASAPTPAFTSMVDMTRSERAMGNDLQDLFKTEAAVTVGTGARNGQKIFLRGVEDLHLNVQVDGARQGANLFHHQSRVQVDPYLLKQVEVNTGPAAADAGPGALGGSVRFETVDAQDLLKPGQAIGARTGWRYESAGQMHGGLASVYGRLNDYTGVLAYVRRESNNEIEAGGGEKREATDGSRDSYLIKGSMLDYEGHSLRLSAQQEINSGGALRANFPWESNVGTVRAGEDQRYSNESYVIRYGFNPEQSRHTDLEATLYHNETGLRRYLDSGTTDWVTRSVGGDLHNTWRFESGALSHALTLGVDHYQDKNLAYESDLILSERARNTGLYLQDRMALGDLRISAGLRQDHYRSFYDNRYETSGDEVSPNLSLEWDLLPDEPQLTLFGGYGESVRGARLNQAGWLGKYTDDFVLGDGRVLQPERALQREWGARWHQQDLLRAGDHAGLELTYYRTRIEDYLITNGEGVGGVTDRIYNADGDITSRGYELRGHWGTETLLLSLAYSHNKLRNYDGQPPDTTGSSARVGAATGDRLVLDTSWQFTPQWELGYTLTGVQRLKDVPAGRPQKPGYAVSDAQLRWTPYGEQEKLVVTFAIDNLFDKRYAEHSTVRVYDGTDELASWEAGRNFKLGVDLFF